jgi:surface protein
MIKINKSQLRKLILDGITTEELKQYDYSHITDMSNLFSNCKNLKTFPLLDTSNVITMTWMFENCINLETVPDLDTSNVKEMSWMFYNCHSLKNIDLFNFKLYKFNNCSSLFLKEKYPEYYI